MNPGTLVCSACARPVPLGTLYCPFCGEAVDPALVAELRWLHRTLTDLDRRIAAGQEATTITALRDEDRERYLTKRTASGIAALPPALSAAMAACQHQTVASSPYCPLCGEAVAPDLVAELQWLHRTTTDLDSRIAAGEGDEPLTRLRAAYGELYAARRHAPQPSPAPALPAAAAPAPPAGAPPPTPGAGPAYAPATPAGPWSTTLPATAVPPPYAGAPYPGAPYGAPPPPSPKPPRTTHAFQWRAFLAEQTIAILVYTGGFLLLVATLVFELGTKQLLGQPVSNDARLIVVAIIYALFGIMGYVFRRMPQLVTVSRGYIATFALLTPLVALAVYLYALKDVGIPAAGMFCLSAAYAAAVYYLLAQQTRAVAYGYLGGAAVVVATQAALPWIGVPWDWWTAALAGAALLLLAPRWLRLPRPLASPSLLVAGVASAIALLGTEVQGLIVLNSTLVLGHSLLSRPAFTTASVALAALALIWTFTLRDQRQPGNALARDSASWAVFALGAQAVVAGAGQAGADRTTMIYLLAALSLVELGGALLWRRLAPARVGARRGVQGLALGLGAAGALAGLGLPDPNWPMIAALLAAGAAALLTGVIERQPWWVIATGLAAALAFNSVAAGVLQSTLPDGTLRSGGYRLDLALLDGGFTLLLWLVALALTYRAPARRYAWPLLVAALCDALAVAALVLTVPHAEGVQTGILAGFALAALLAGRRMGEPISANLVTGVFGALAVLPFLRETDGLQVALAGLAWAALALVARWLLGRRWAIAPYAVAAWAILAAELRLLSGQVQVPGWTPPGLPFDAWFLLTAALPATLVVVIENQPALVGVPAVLVLGAIARTSDLTPLLAMTLGLAAVGIALRQWRGRWWDVGLLAAATVGALLVVARQQVPIQQATALWEQIAFLVLLAALAYAATRVARGQLETTVAATLLVILPLALDAVRLGQAIWWLVLLQATLVVVATLVRGRSRAPASPLLPVMVFGALAILPLTLLPQLPASVGIAIVGVLPALVALGMRRALGWAWTGPAYGVAALSIVSTEIYFLASPPTFVLGTPLTAWFLFAAALPALFAAAWERFPWLIIAPSLLWLLAILATSGSLTRCVCVLLLVGGGILLRQWRGRWWSFFPFVAAALAALVVVFQLDTQTGTLQVAQRAAFLVLLVLGGYVALLLDRGEVETTLVVIGLIFLPMLLESFHADPTWLYTSALAVEAMIFTILGVGMRERTQQVVGLSVLGIAVLRGAVLALQRDVPVVIVLAVLALLLMTGAMWISLRRRASVPAR